MSLKGFHTVFIVASILLSFGFGYWGYYHYGQNQELGYLITCIASTLVGILLIAYETYFLRKLSS